MPNIKGNKHTEEARKRISEAVKSNWLNNPDRKSSMYGKKHSDETRKKISIANIGKISWAKGKKFSDEHRKKIGLANSISQKGKNLSQATKEKISKAMRGNKTHLWKGGISKEPGYTSFMAKQRKLRKIKAFGSHSLREWELLKAQYNHTCPCCYKSEPEIKLTEDHIIPLSYGGSDYIGNIQPLCNSCNSSKKVKIIIFNGYETRQRISFQGF